MANSGLVKSEVFTPNERGGSVARKGTLSKRSLLGGSNNIFDGIE